MQEVKQPNKKPFIFYYLIALVAIMLINSLLVPQIVQRAVKEVDYNTFMQMTYDKQIDEVQVQDNQIVFTAKDDKTIYKTGLMDDPDRTQRLYDSGAKFSSEIVEEASPLLSFLISWLLPLIIIIGFGQLMYRQMAKKAGGDSMMFGMGGMGKSNAKVYVKSSNGIKFTDVAGEDEAKENLTEIVEYLHDPDKYKEIGASMPKGILLVGPPGTGKTLLAKAVALRFRFHLIDATLKGFKARHRLIQFTAIQLATHIAGRTRRLMAQRQRLLTGAGFAEFVLQLANLFFHPRQGFIHQLHFMIQLSDKVGQLLFFDQRRPGQIFFLFAQGQLGFFLPFRLLGDRLLNTT